MNVKTFYENGNKVFSGINPPFTLQEEIDILNTIFKQKYLYSVIVDYLPPDKIAETILNKNLPYYESIMESYKIIFDPLVNKGYTEENIDTRNISDITLKEENVTSSDTRDVTESSNSESRKEDTFSKNIDVTITDATTNNLIDTSNSSVNDVKTSTGENTQNKNAYNSTSMTPTEKSSTSNNDVMESTKTDTMTKTGTVSSEAKNISNEETSTISNDTSSNVKTVTEDINRNSKVSGKGDKTVVDSGTGVKTVTGFDNIDYAKAIQDYYETKKINIFDIVVDDVYNMVCLPLYEFE